MPAEVAQPLLAQARVGLLAALDQVVEPGVRTKRRPLREPAPPIEELAERDRTVGLARWTPGATDRTLGRTEAVDVDQLVHVRARKDRRVRRLTSPLAVAEQADPVAERLHHACNVAHVLVPQIAVGPAGVTMAARIDRDHAEALGEQRREQVEAATVVPHSVTQHERLTLWVTPLVQAQAKAMRIEVTAAHR
jgi:hypothetical protein